MTGAIEFLQKAKEICATEDFRTCEGVCFMIIDCIMGMENAPSEADLVREVMAYQIKEVSDAERD